MVSNIQTRLQHDWREESIWDLLHHRLFIKEKKKGQTKYERR